MSPNAPSSDTPTVRAVFRAQARRTLGARRRGLSIVLGLVLLQILVLATTGIVFGVHGSASSTGPDGETVRSEVRLADLDDLDLGIPMDNGLGAVWLAGAAGLLWAVFWPSRVWRHEAPPRRDYHWSMPVNRRRHDALRVAAGAAWLLAICALLVGTAVVTSALLGQTRLIARLTPWFWINLAVGPLLVYGLLSILYLRNAHPDGWLWGGLWGGGTLLSLLATLAPETLGRPILAITIGPQGLLTTVGGPLFREVGSIGASRGGPIALGWLLWASLIVAGLWAAASTRSRRL